MRKVLIVIGVIVLVLVLLLLAGGVGMMGAQMAPLMMRGGAVRGLALGGFGLGILGLLLRILFWAIIIGGIVWLVSALVRGGTQPVTAAVASRETPLDVLKMRLAKGEITKEQYDQLKNDLQV